MLASYEKATQSSPKITKIASPAIRSTRSTRQSKSPILLNKTIAVNQQFQGIPTLRRRDQSEQIHEQIVMGNYEIEFLTENEDDEQLVSKSNEDVEVEILGFVSIDEENVVQEEKEAEADSDADEDYVPEKKVVKRKPVVFKSRTLLKQDKIIYKPVIVEVRQEALETTEDLYFKTLLDVDTADLDEKMEKKIFQCAFDGCTETFARRQACKTHFFNHKATSYIQKGFSCKFCQKAFHVASAVERHERVHTGDKPFKCDQKGCEKAFSQREMLKRHKLIHLSIDDAPFACNICDKKFRQKEPLRRHINKAHSEDAESQSQAFVCTVCQKTFAHSSGLSRHLLIHSGRKFTCDVCDKAFNDQSALKRHRKIHNK